MRSAPYQQVDPDCDHQFKPRWEFGDDLTDEGSNGVSIVRLMKLSFIQPIYQDYVVIF